MKPTKEQQEIIDRQGGVLLVNACPGSGKTATLVQRTRSLPITETKLVLAFNKKAATEFDSRLSDGLLRATVKTFHSFCMAQIFSNPSAFGFLYGRPRLNTDGLFYQISQACELQGRGWDQCGLDESLVLETENCWYDEDLKRAIFSAKTDVGEELTEGELLSITARNRTLATLLAVEKYRDWLVKNNMFTFASAIRLVAQNRHKLKNRYDHLMVDEFQDVDRFQFDIIAAMGKVTGVKSVVCVGDKKQRIYEWRGALYDAFHSFLLEFPKAQVLPLTVNFRSSSEIVQLAEQIYPCGMTAVRGSIQGSVQMDPPDSLQKLIKHKGVDHTNLAILCRYNRHCAQWQLRLAKENIPVFVLGGGSFWRSCHVQMALSFRGVRDAWWHLQNHRSWQLFTSTRRFIVNPQELEEVEADAQWILSVSDADLELLKSNIQNKLGVQVSTIHKTKGLEWDAVILSHVDERLRKETCVFYVGATRARQLLIIENDDEPVDMVGEK